MLHTHKQLRCLQLDHVILKPYCACSWYIEWVGFRQSHHEAWLDPCAMVLRAAFETLQCEQQEAADIKPGRTEAVLAWLKSRVLG